MSFIYNAIFYKPLLNGLALLINVLPGHSIGLAVIILTLVVRFIIFPFSHKSTKSQEKMKELEPELKKIKEQYKDDKQEQAKKTMELYKVHGINPLTSFVVLLVQLPFIWALYQVFLGGVTFDPTKLYSFVDAPQTISLSFLWLTDITKSNLFLGFLSGVSQFFLTQVSMPSVKKDKTKPAGELGFGQELAKSMNFQFKYLMPLFVFWISTKLSGAVALYWTTSNIFAILHAISVKKKAAVRSAPNLESPKRFGAGK